MQADSGVVMGRGRRIAVVVLLATLAVLVIAKPVAGPSPVPTPTPTLGPTVTGPYGSINADTKANLRVGPDGVIAHRFIASTTSALTSVRFSQRGGDVYSGGTGGTMRITVRPDDGSGPPSSTVLAAIDYKPGNAGGSWTTYLALSFPTPATLTKGATYQIVFQNTDPDPDVNYISVNELLVYNGILSPRQPLFADSAYAVLAKGRVEGEYTAVMDLTYANGVHDGMGYVEAMIARFGVVSGTDKMVREHFTVSADSRLVSSASVRVRRTNGTSPLIVTLETDDGVAIESVSIPAASIAVSAPGGDDGGAVWVTATFTSTHVLIAGTTYDLRLSTAGDTEYTTVPLREGTDKGFGSAVFGDGSGQRTTNGRDWSNLYDASPVDLQFVFR